MEKKALTIKLQVIKKINGFNSCIKNKNSIVIIIFSALLIISVLALYTIISCDPETLLIIALITLQMISVFTDIKWRIIPLKLMLLGFGTGVFILIMFYRMDMFISCSLGGAAAVIIMWFIIIISKRQVGYGDLTLMAVTGLYAGISRIFAILFFSLVFSGVYSFSLILAKRANSRTEIPFAPFVLLSTISIVLFSANA